MKHIVLFGAGKSSTYLIEYLVAQLLPNNWRLTVLDADLVAAEEKTGKAANTFVAYVDVQNAESRRKWIAEADLLISLLPPALHQLVAMDCLEFGKNLLTASYVDDRLKLLNDEVAKKGLLFLGECGLDPGIDHMSAKKIINDLKKRGATIRSFVSHCGGLVAPESNDNPWKYKISWNPRNVVMAGKSGALYRENGNDVRMNYESLFDAFRKVEIEGLGTFCWYPNRDSLSYADIYGLNEAATFIRTTLRYPEFCFGWKNVIELNLTNEDRIYDTDGMTLQQFFQLHMKQNEFPTWLTNQVTARFSRTKKLLEKLEELLEAEGQMDEELLEELQDFMIVSDSGTLVDINLEEVKINAAATVAGQMQEASLAMQQLFYLGMDDNNTLINLGRCSAADVLQFALEKKLVLNVHDKDMVVMLHEIGYELEGKAYLLRSKLMVKGENSIKTAMAKTVGLPLGIAAKLILQQKITLTGVHIPIHPEIYEPILQELAEYGIGFEENVRRER